MGEGKVLALEHPKFKALIDVASCTTNGVKIPGQKATQADIMHMFKDHLMMLKAQLSVHVPSILLSSLIVS